MHKPPLPLPTTTTPTTTPKSLFPPQYTFPPFFTRQPNTTTFLRQRALWASFILSYCKHHRLWRLNVSDALETELFWNRGLGRRVKYCDAVEMIDGGVGKSTLIVWWRKPEEWAGVIYDWIDSTGQKNTVLTLYEIAEGDLTGSTEFRGIDQFTLRKALEVLTKRGQAQIFSINDESGVKFF
ncbi:ESCRT-II complex subunit-domain-containing protein [Peziza echinospora]|nr:ESCRT-II complex subunit-domain-containing protein [Peziza echinospora]